MNEIAELAVELAATFYGVTPKQVLDRRISVTTVNARFAAWNALHLLYGWGCGRIGDEFGFNHSTVSNGFDRASPDATEFVRQGLSVARETAARRVTLAQTPGDAGEPDAGGTDLSRDPDRAIPKGAGNPLPELHPPLKPGDCPRGGPALAFVRAGGDTDSGPITRRLARTCRTDGSENAGGQLGLLRGPFGRGVSGLVARIGGKR